MKHDIQKTIRAALLMPVLSCIAAALFMLTGCEQPAGNKAGSGSRGSILIYARGLEEQAAAHIQKEGGFYYTLAFSKGARAASGPQVTAVLETGADAAVVQLEPGEWTLEAKAYHSEAEAAAAAESGGTPVFEAGFSSIAVDAGVTADIRDYVSSQSLIGAVTITGDPAVQALLIADITELPGDGRAVFQWQVEKTSGNTVFWQDITGAGNQTFTPPENYAFSRVRVAVQRAGYRGSIVSEPTTELETSSLPQITGIVSIAGTPQSGETLSANTAQVSGDGELSIIWQIGLWPDEGFVDLDTGDTYVVTDGDTGKYIRVLAQRSENSGSLVSAVIEVAESDLPALTGTVTIPAAGDPGTELAAVTTGLNGTGGLFYQWQKSEFATVNFRNIADADAAAYTPTPDDAGYFIRVSVGRQGYQGSVLSAPAGIGGASTELAALIGVSAAVLPSSAPQLGGAVYVSALNHTAYSNATGAVLYQWQRSTNAAFTEFADIAGANGVSYILCGNDAGKKFRVKISFSGNSGAYLSALTQEVPRASIVGTFAVSGNNWVGGTLGADLSELSNVFGDISYRWQRALATATLVWNDIPGAAGPSYTPVAADEGYRVQLIISTDANLLKVSSNTLVIVADANAPNFTLKTTIDSAVMPIGGMAYGGGKFVIARNYQTTSNIAYSTDGLTWMPVNLGSGNETTFYGAAYGEISGTGRFVCVGYKTSGQLPAIYTSTDGVSWTGGNITSTGELLYCIAYGNGTFVVVSSKGKIRYKNATVEDWTEASTSIFGSTAINGVVYGGGKFIAWSGAKMAVSPDGIIWTEITPVTSTFTASGKIETVTASDTRIWAIGRSNNTTSNIAYSDDGGTTWTALTSIPAGLFNGLVGGSNNDVRTATHGAGLFVAINQNGKVAYCADGSTTWRIGSLEGMGAVGFPGYGGPAIAYNGNTFVAGAGHGASVFYWQKPE